VPQEIVLRRQIEKPLLDLLQTVAHELPARSLPGVGAGPRTAGPLQNPLGLLVGRRERNETGDGPDQPVVLGGGRVGGGPGTAKRREVLVYRDSCIARDIV